MVTGREVVRRGAGALVVGRGFGVLDAEWLGAGVADDGSGSAGVGVDEAARSGRVAAAGWTPAWRLRPTTVNPDPITTAVAPATSR
jgi:hypothetical protein